MLTMTLMLLPPRCTVRELRLRTVYLHLSYGYRQAWIVFVFVRTSFQTPSFVEDTLPRTGACGVCGSVRCV